MAANEYSKWHTYCSFVKSTLRIVGCVMGLTGNLVVFALLMLVAECVGIVEELG